MVRLGYKQARHWHDKRFTAWHAMWCANVREELMTVREDAR